MINLEKGSDAELSYRTSTMTWDEARKVLADRPDLLTIQRRLRGIDRSERFKALLAQRHPKPRTKDVRDMTVQDLCDLAKEVRSAPVGSRKMRRAADRMSIAAWQLEGSGALQQMLWWHRGIEPEAPLVLEMPRRDEPQE
jgi:hypothetical protein